MLPPTRAKDNDEDKTATCIIRGVNTPLLLQKLKRPSFESPLLVEELWKEKMMEAGFVRE